MLRVISLRFVSKIKIANQRIYTFVDWRLGLGRMTIPDDTHEFFNPKVIKLGSRAADCLNIHYWIPRQEHPVPAAHYIFTINISTV